MAFLFKTELPPVRKYIWETEDYSEEDDEFMKQFDEDGNFIEHKEDDPNKTNSSLNITYHYKKSNPEEPQA